MISLKAFAPELAPFLYATPVALYERQRALTAGGLLDLGAGQGPASGVRLSGQSAAVLLISFLGTDFLSDTAADTALFAKMVAQSGKCPITGKKNFQDALATVLTSEDALNKVGDITLRRGSVRGIFYSPDDKENQVSYFMDRGRHTPMYGVDIAARLPKRVLRAIAHAVMKRLRADPVEVVRGR